MWKFCDEFLKDYTVGGSGWRSCYSDSLRAERSGDRIPMGARFSAPVQPAPGLTQSPGKWTPCLSRGGKAAGASRSPPTSI